MLIVDIGHIPYDEGIYPESAVRSGFGYFIALCSPANTVFCNTAAQHFRENLDKGFEPILDSSVNRQRKL
jgi:hypothetical protein